MHRNDLRRSFNVIWSIDHNRIHLPVIVVAFVGNSVFKIGLKPFIGRKLLHLNLNPPLVVASSNFLNAVFEKQHMNNELPHG